MFMPQWNLDVSIAAVWNIYVHNSGISSVCQSVIITPWWMFNSVTMDTKILLFHVQINQREGWIHSEDQSIVSKAFNSRILTLPVLDFFFIRNNTYVLSFVFPKLYSIKSMLNVLCWATSHRDSTVTAPLFTCNIYLFIFIFPELICFLLDVLFNVCKLALAYWK